MRNAVTILIILLQAFIFIRCDEDHSENEQNISKNFDDDSHKTGTNCMTCHVKGGNGEGWFSVAGTIYDSLLTTTVPNGAIKIFSVAGNPDDLVATIEVDGLGNFFTTEPIDLANGLYVSVSNDEGATKSMVSPVYNGSCNSCHDGSTVEQIWVK